MTEKIRIGAADALIAVDVQNDFCPGGALAVAGGDEVVAVINRVRDKFARRVFTRDWHPPNHVSFAVQPRFVDMSWPAHCVQETAGAEFHPDLVVGGDDIIVSKGTEDEAYSGFQGTELVKVLHALDVKRVFVAGLATDYCVKATAMDAIGSGFEAYVLSDAIRAVDPAGTGPQAVKDMAEAGAVMIESADLE